MAARKFEYNGELHTLPEIAELTGINVYTLRARIYRQGHTAESAAAIGVRGRGRPRKAAAEA